MTSPRPCGQRIHAGVRRRAELAQRGSEVLRKARAITATPSLALTCRVHSASSAGSRPAPANLSTSGSRGPSVSSSFSATADDVVGINRAGLTFFRRDPASAHISEVYLAPFRKAAFVQPCPAYQHHLGIGPGWLAFKLLADLPQRL